MNRPIILASGSPRRHYLLKEAGFEFSVIKTDTDESFPEIPADEVATYLARKKAAGLLNKLQNEILITADTIVVLDGEVMNKPLTEREAIEMLTRLSGKTHTVITGVCIADKDKTVVFDDRTSVTFNTLSIDEIIHYVKNFAPYDKAGAYGAQDWIGMIAIKEIQGSYFNVMGLPIHRVYQVLRDWK